MKQLELLAPAKDFETAREAILHGADAVYIGAPSHGARARAVNSLDDIRRVVEFAAPFRVKVYVTVNTLIYDEEIAQVEQMIRQLYAIGVDALIVQDMAVLKMNIPPIALHASTQCDTRNAVKARFLQDAGFSQIVVARELGLEEIRDIAGSVTVPIEAFVHGALCVCYSGDCQASYVATGRSANRGECAQMCRLPYDLYDADGNCLGRQRHYLSLKDMKRIESLAEMADTGVTSFKIEGRLKDKAYVKNVVASYRRALDEIINANPEKYCRQSLGFSELAFQPQLSKSFNREFTPYFLRNANPGKIATFYSPKAMGEPIGEVKSSKGKLLEAKLTAAVSNGDGLSYIRPDGATGGFRVNRAENGRLFLAEPIQLAPGTRLFRSFDKAWEDSMARPTAHRSIPVDIELRPIGTDRIALSGSIDGCGTVTVAVDVSLAPSEKPDNGYRRSVIAKLGNTIFTLRNFSDKVGDSFIPASALTDARRKLTDAMEHALRATRPIDRRVAPSVAPQLPQTMTAITRHDNVANSLAREFYREAGATSVDNAIEIEKPKESNPVVMTTRYCLRRELGKCLKTERCAPDKRHLFLKAPGVNYRLDFDCANCRMKVSAITAKQP